MIRALALLLFGATSAIAQTPVAVSVANNLKMCIYDAQGVRDAMRVAQLGASLERARTTHWANINEIAPGIFRLTSPNQNVVIEMKLPDAQGQAHCMIFGPILTQGQGALAADKFVEFQMMAGLTQAPPPPGTTRRYVLSNAPYTAELIAYSVAGGGDVVGFIFDGVPKNLTTRALSANDRNVSYRGVSGALSNAINICLRNYFMRNTVETSLPAGGFELGFTDGRDQNKRTFFTTDNAVSLRIAPGQCQIETNYLNPSATVQIVQEALNTNAPGQFEYRAQNHNGCAAFYAGPRLNLPLGINVYNNSGQRGPATCIEDGTTRITFVVAG